MTIMFERTMWSAILAAAIAVPGAAAAQQPRDYCRLIYPEPQIGDFAVVEMSNPGVQERTRMRFALVGTQKLDGKTHYWIEIATRGESGPDVPPMIIQVLVPGYPFDGEQIREYIIQVGEPPPMRVDPERIQEMTGGTPSVGWKQECAAAEDLGVEQVEVPAGRFEARHLRSREQKPGELWLADVPFGMARFVDPDGFRLELVEYGTRAVSSIDRTEAVPFRVPSREPAAPDREDR